VCLSTQLTDQHIECVRDYESNFMPIKKWMLTLSVKQFPTVPTDSSGQSYNSIANGRTYLITAASSVEFCHISWCFLTPLHSQLTLITNNFPQNNFKHELTSRTSAREYHRRMLPAAFVPLSYVLKSNSHYNWGVGHSSSSIEVGLAHILVYSHQQ
jgi:hypothetical protein